MDSVMEEEDPVVQEIPVYLSQALSKNLYIYQFPVRPANREWKDLTVTNASIKPKNELVRLEVALDTYSDKYCPSKGEQIALNTDGSQDRYIKDKEKERSLYFRHGMMDKIVYESHRACTDTQHYAAAILQDKELHITPIQGVMQLKPSYSYYDKQDKRRSDRHKADNSDEEEPEAKQVTVKFARQETDVAKKAREKSYEAMSQRLAQEAWYDGLWKHSNTDYAELERLKLFSQTTSEGSALTLHCREYVRALVPPAPEDLEMGIKENETLQQQIQNALVNAKLLTFNEVRALVARRRPDVGPDTEAALLAALGSVGCLVRGLWAPRSELLYPEVAGPGAGPGPGQPPARLLRAARDRVLYLLRGQAAVERAALAGALRLPAAQLLAVLGSVARPAARGWRLLLPPDAGFEAAHPDLVQRQNLYWEARQRCFADMLIGETPHRRQRNKSHRDSAGDDDADRKRTRNKSTSGAGKRTRNVSSSSALDG